MRRAPAAILLMAACSALRSLPGSDIASGALSREAERNRDRIARNLVGVVQSGEYKKKASFSMEQEFYLGKSVAADVVTRLGGRALPPGHAASRYLRDVGTVVALAAAELREQDDRPYPLKGYRFILVEASQVNAVGMPGGFVAVTSGAFRAVRGEDELAAVLAHEIAHIQKGHAIRPVEVAREQENLTSAMLAGTSPVVHTFFGKAVSAAADFVLDKGYGKANELEADAFAARILSRAGYDPAALSAFLSRLTGAAAEGGFFQRHPPAAERVAALAREGTASRAAAPERTARFGRVVSSL